MGYLNDVQKKLKDYSNWWKWNSDQSQHLKYTLSLMNGGQKNNIIVNTHTSVIMNNV